MAITRRLRQWLSGVPEHVAFPVIFYGAVALLTVAVLALGWLLLAR
jgi:hypothetical protein